MNNLQCAALALILSAGSLAVGCAPEVIGGPSGNTGQNLDGNTGGNPPPPSTSGGSGTHTAVAMTRAQLDVRWDEYWANEAASSGTVTVGGGNDNLDPNDLFLEISNQGASCSAPTTALSCGGNWSLSVALPPSYQAVGIYDLEDPAIAAYSTMSESGALNSANPEDCSWGGGSLGSGTLEVLSIDGQEIHFVVTMNSFLDADPSGEYTAIVCAP
jgi:hypothetical protein